MNRRRSVRAGLRGIWLALLVAVGCGDDITNLVPPTQETRHGTVVAVVRSLPDRTPLVGAHYRILGSTKSGNSDADGVIILENMAQGRHLIMLSAPGHATTRVEMVVEFDSASKEEIVFGEDFGLPALTGALDIQVNGSDTGEPIPNARIYFGPWKFSGVSQRHLVEDASVPTSFVAGENGHIRIEQLPRLGVDIMFGYVDADEDGNPEYASMFLNMAAGSPSAPTQKVYLSRAADAKVVASNIPRYYSTGSWLDGPIGYLVFSTPMRTGPGEFECSIYRGSGQVPVEVRWVTDFRLEFEVAPADVPEWTTYNAAIRVTSLSGMGVDASRSFYWWPAGSYDDPPPAQAGDCESLVAEFTATPADGVMGDRTRILYVSWEAADCADGYYVYAQDTENNPDWVQVLENSVDLGSGQVFDIVTLPGEFDRFSSDSFQTPFAGTSVTLAVVPRNALDPDPDVHPQLTLADLESPTMKPLRPFNLEPATATTPASFRIDVALSEYIDGTSPDPTIEFREAGGDPAYVLDQSAATWTWLAGRANGYFTVEIPDGVDADGDEFIVRFDELRDLSGNVSSAVASDWTQLALFDYAFDFEGSPQGWYALSGQLWQWGTPTYSGGPNGAGGGESCWGTNLSGSYYNSYTAEVQSPLVAIPDTGSELRFLRWYYLYSTTDNVKVQVVHELGVTNVHVFNSGSATGWLQQTIDLSAYAGQMIRLRFRFQSDSYSYGPGFYFDDVQLVAY